MSAACTIFGVAVLAMLLAGYLGQQYLPPPTPKVVGIDLGTTFSCVGVYEAVTGEVHVIPDRDGHSCIPSIVAFSEDGIVVGHKAAAQSQLRPDTTIYDAKRFIGLQLTKSQLEAESSRYPFKMTLDKTGQVNFDVGLVPKMEQSDGRKNIADSGTLTPVTIGTRIVSTLKQTAETNLGIPITKAVMAVPAEFSEEQRNQTKLVAKLAGLEVLRVINEPTAAALAYGLHKKEGTHSVMVVDLGGGTLDVSLLYIQGGMFLTAAMAGNSHLGGQDFTHRLAQYCLQLINKQFGQPLTDPEDIQALRTAVEAAKLNLTYNDSASIDIPCKILAARHETRWRYKLTRETFEKINHDLFDKVLEPIKLILKSRELGPEDIDEIVLVGGSTRIPQIRTILKKFFKKDLNVSIDPELAVTYGVSIQAGILGGMWPLTVSAIELPTTATKMRLH